MHQPLLALTLVLGFTCAAANNSPAAVASKTTGKPNIVVVLFDDMGWGQPKCYNARSELCTPRFDQLATEGMRFHDAHSASAVCTPTRYGLLTGCYPSRIGQYGVLTTYSRPLISTDRTTLASFLKQQGYATACIGKWHLGLNWVDGHPGTEKQVPIGARTTGGPNALGFDYFCGFTHARNIGSIIEQDRVVAHVDPVENQPLMIRKALEWIGQRKPSEPFFLYFPMCPPHEPIVPARDFIGKSGARDVVGRHASYGDWVYQGDAMLGQIMDALKRHELAENTLLIATSDNGAERRAYPPLRESKRSIYEGGHRVPFVARWPGRVKPGSVWRHPVCLNDLLATVSDLTGQELPSTAGVDSVSFLPALLGTTGRPTREATVHQSAVGDLAIRQENWKLIFHKDGHRELFDLSADLGETNNVQLQQAEITARLTTLMQSYLDRGRSTPGTPQSNKNGLALPGSSPATKTPPTSSIQ